MAAKSKKREPAPKSYWADMDDNTGLRWVVRSRSSTAKYLVDLSTWECQCPDFECVQRKKLKAGGERKDCACFHLTTALRQFWRQIVVPSIPSTPIMRRMSADMLRRSAVDLSIAMADEVAANLPQDAESALDISRPKIIVMPMNEAEIVEDLDRFATERALDSWQRTR